MRFDIIKVIMMDGWISLNKPAGINSNKINAQLRRIIGTKKTGYAGTLDPFAHGVLPIAVERATRFIPYLMHQTKEYQWKIRWGIKTSTADLDGEVINTSPRLPTYQEIIDTIPQFIGTIEQIPNKFSAIKVNGRRAYHLARNNQEFEIPPRNVQIYNLQLLNHSGEESEFITECSSGTYIRTLGEDIAASLNTLGYLTSLKRTRVGPFHIDQSISLEEVSHNFIPIDFVLTDFPRIILNQEDARRLCCGQIIQYPRSDNNEVAVYHENGRFLGIAIPTDDGLKPYKIVL